MKIGIRPDTYERWGDNRYLKMKEHGYSCANYVMVDTNKLIYQCTEEEFVAAILRDKALAQAAGIEITQVHGPFRMPAKDLELEDRKERMEKMKRSIHATALLDCKYWVVHPLMPYGITDLETGHVDDTWTINVEFMKELLVIAKEYDVVICLENMPYKTFSLAAPKDIYRFVTFMNDDHFKMCLDTGHANVFPDVNPPDITREYGEIIKVLHIHDNNGYMDLHRMPYYGNVDWKDFYKALQEVGFEGDFSLETEPSRSLPTHIYEELCLIMVKVTEHIFSNKE